MSADLAAIEARLERIESMLARLVGQQEPAPPAGMSPDAARLISLARHDREAAIAEAKRLAREHTRGEKHA